MFSVIFLDPNMFNFSSLPPPSKRPTSHSNRHFYPPTVNVDISSRNNLVLASLWSNARFQFLLETIEHTSHIFLPCT
jgi:hypothetical protein